jgi:hypothetical protein
MYRMYKCREGMRPPCDRHGWRKVEQRREQLPGWRKCRKRRSSFPADRHGWRKVRAHGWAKVEQCRSNCREPRREQQPRATQGAVAGMPRSGPADTSKLRPNHSGSGPIRNKALHQHLYLLPLQFSLSSFLCNDGYFSTSCDRENKSARLFCARTSLRPEKAGGSEEPPRPGSKPQG